MSETVLAYAALAVASVLWVVSVVLLAASIIGLVHELSESDR